MAGAFDVNGIAFLSNFNGDFTSPAGLAAMQEVAATGANSIELAPRIFTETKTSNDVIIDPAKTESDANIAVAIEQAHKLGLSVLLKPQITGLDGTNQAQLTPSDPASFFASYTAEMVDLAKVAQDSGATSFSIGNELSALSGAQYKDYWDTLISDVREVYHGTITYSAATDEANHVSFWDEVDEIGINAYPPLTSKLDPTVDDMIQAWNSVPKDNYWSAAMDNMSPVDFFHHLSEQYGKDVVFTETGYRSLDGTNISPGGGSGDTPDPQEQADAFKAFFEVWSAEGGSWFKGAEIWGSDIAHDMSPTSYSPLGKPAGDVVTQWYDGQQHPQGLIVVGSAIADVIDIGSGNDMISGGLGGDTIHGGAGDDTIVAGPDAISALTETTVTVTGYGSVVDGVGAQMELLINGQQVGSTVEFHDAADSDGYQTFTFTFDNPDDITSFDVAFINDFADASGDRNLYIKGITINGHDLLVSDTSNLSSPGTWNLYGNRTIHLDTAGHQDLFFGSGSDNDFVSGGDGNDVINGGAGSDILHGDTGDDTITSGPGLANAPDQLFGDDGNDILIASAGDTGAMLDGGAGNDQLYGSVANNTMNGGDGNDYMTGGGGLDTMLGGAGDDTLKGASGATQMYGQDGNDTLSGGAGNEYLSGGNGNDILNGGGGNDTLNGGAGSDTFAFGANFGKDVIAAFDTAASSHDIIQFDHTIFADFNAVQAHMTQSGHDVIIMLDANDTIDIRNATASHLTADDFRFV
jgi:Ca2+-binding RTX toxin-like protein